MSGSHPTLHSTDLPTYADLPQRANGTRTAWGLLDPLGIEAGIGRLRLLTDHAIRDAAALVRTGEVISLNAPIGLFDPPLFGRRKHRQKSTVVRDGFGVDDAYDDFFPQASSQWDGLNHASNIEGEFYNGFSLDDVLAGRGFSIASYAERGIVGRGVLLDLAGVGTGPTFAPLVSHAITPADLEQARERVGLTWQSGDILLLRTGFTKWYRGLDPDGRRRVSDASQLRCPGLARSEETLEYLWDAGIAAVASDNPAVEHYPTDHSPDARPYGVIHRSLIAELGFALGELWDLDALAAACANDGRFEFLLTAAPLNAPGGFGSTANALALR